MKRVLTVGLTYTGDKIEGVEIENLGLCQPDVNRERAAYPLYEYDTIIINPESYTHFLFGKADLLPAELGQAQVPYLERFTFRLFSFVVSVDPLVHY